MENNNHKKRKVMLIAAFAVAVIALAGIGYAAITDYKATTVNSGNTAASNHIVVTQDGTYSADFNTAVEFNTYTDSTGTGATKVIYSLTSDSTVVGEYKGSKVGDVILTMESTVDMTNYNLKATRYAGTLADGWTFILKAGSSYLYYNPTADCWAATPDGTASATITVTSGVTVELWIASNVYFDAVSPAPYISTLDGYAGLDGYTGYPASRSAPAENVVNNVILMFEITGNTAA